MDGIFYADSGGNLQGRGYTWSGGGGGGGQTKFGFNYNSDTSYQTIAGRKSMFNNRVPCVRIYNTGLMPSTFSISQNIAQEKCASWSFKEGNDLAGLAAGNYNSSMTSWLNGIPSGWTIYWTFHHEVNSSTGLDPGMDATSYKQVYHQMRTCLNNANLSTGTNVFITCNFMSYGLSGFQQSWVPPRADCDIMTFDAYGNPGSVGTSSTTHNKYGPSTAEGGDSALGRGYADTYPLPSDRLAGMFSIIDTAGYADSWGLLEVNAPLRNWDADESGRAQFLQDYINLCMAPPMTGSVPPKIMLMWEATSGANWNQAFGYNTDTTTTPQGTNKVYASNPANSPCWDVWYPYMTGSP